MIPPPFEKPPEQRYFSGNSAHLTTARAEKSVRLRPSVRQPRKSAMFAPEGSAQTPLCSTYFFLFHRRRGNARPCVWQCGRGLARCCEMRMRLHMNCPNDRLLARSAVPRPPVCPSDRLPASRTDRQTGSQMNGATTERTDRRRGRLDGQTNRLTDRMRRVFFHFNASD